MKLWSLSLTLVALGSTLVAQQFTASLSANLPIQARLGVIQSPPTPGPATAGNTRPAGLLTTHGSVSDVAPGGSIAARTNWYVPVATRLGCSLVSSFPSPAFGQTYPYHGFFDTDLTLTINGPAGRWGEVIVSFECYRDERATVDIGDDGSIECRSLSSGIPSFHGGLTREWRIPVQLTGAPLPIRIIDTHDTTGFGAETITNLAVDFVPWASTATNLGSLCGQSATGWIGFTSVQYQYALGLREGIAGAAATAVARGYGPLATFVVSSQSARQPVGAIGLGYGCDDLLLGAVAIASGQLASPTPWSFAWWLQIPPLPPGLTLYFQHVSMGADPAFWQLHFGVSNVVEYRT